MNQEVNDYISTAPGEQKQIMQKVRELVHQAVPAVTEEFKWGRPVFRSSRDFAYLKSAKAYVTLGFFDAGKLDDPAGLLEGTGKDMRHIKLKKTTDVDATLLKKWLKAAAKE